MSSNHFQRDENGRAPVRAGTVGFNDASLEATSGRRSFPEGFSDELLEGRGGEARVGQSFGSCDKVGVYFGFHYLNRASIARRTSQFPVKSPGKLSFKEVNSTLAVGRYVNGLETVSVPSA